MFSEDLGGWHVYIAEDPKQQYCCFSDDIL